MKIYFDEEYGEITLTAEDEKETEVLDRITEELESNEAYLQHVRSDSGRICFEFESF